jgi:ribosomal protein S18 acetylase RimI-like enzyme
VISVRPVLPHEYEVAGAIVLAAYEALAGNHMSGGYAEELVDVRRRVEDAEVLVAVVDDRLAGCVTFVPDRTSPLAERLQEGESAIRMLGVDPGAQGAGIGTLLVQECIRSARALGRRALFLHSTPWMTAAHRLYERAGFVRVPERDWLPVPDIPLMAFRLHL